MFLFAFIFLSLIAHVYFSVIENECSALRFLLFKQGTPRPVTRQVPSVKGCRRTSVRGSSGRFYQYELNVWFQGQSGH